MNTVWFRYHSTNPEPLFLVTGEMFTFDIVVAVYTGARGSLTEVACDESTTTSGEMRFDTTANTTYYFMVAGYAFGSYEGAFPFLLYRDTGIAGRVTDGVAGVPNPAVWANGVLAACADSAGYYSSFSYYSPETGQPYIVSAGGSPNPCGARPITSRNGGGIQHTGWRDDDHPVSRQSLGDEHQLHTGARS
jgi:hypothetical protein